jgi:hypothetical protein
MKKLKFSSLFILAISVLLFSGCKDDDTPEVSPFVGNYVISKAILAEAVTIPIVAVPGIGDKIVLPAEYDITEAIQGSLLSQVNCSSADKSWVELREDNSMFMSCEGTNELNAGTWDEISATELKLNMNNAAIPSSPTGFVLNVTDIVQANNTLSGKTSVPLPKEMVAEMIKPLSLAASAPPVFMLTFTIEFIKKS